jgi:cell wall-associated NlpC family hydrolase
LSFQYKYPLLTLLFAFLFLSASAQSKKADKLHKLYLSDNSRKAEKRASKMLEKDANDPDALYIRGLLLLDAAKADRSPAQVNRKITKAIAVKRKISIDNPFHQALGDSIHAGIIAILNDKQLNDNYKKKYLALLAKEFSDTLAGYYANTSGQNYNGPMPQNRWPMDSLRNALLLFAGNLQGINYKWAGESPKTGFDCSGFTKYVFQSVGIELPHNAQKQSELIPVQKTLEEALPGDLIFFGSKNEHSFRTQHAAIVYSKTGNEIKVIHCVSNGVNIDGENSSWDQYWADRVLFVIDPFSYSKNESSE